MAALAFDKPRDHSAPSLRAQAIDGLKKIQPDHWDALVPPGSAALTHSYLAAWERSELSGLCSSPVVAGQPGSERPLAACPGYFYELDLVEVRFPAATDVLAPIRRVRPGFLYALTYELGSPTPLTNPFLVADQGLRAQAVPKLIGAALAEGSRRAAQFLLVQNFTSLEGPAAEELQRLGFAGVPILPTAVVDLPYESFDDYLAAMRAQYRRRARQTLKRSCDLHIEHCEDFGGLADDLARLWRRIYDRAREVKREILTPAYFRAIAGLQDSSVLLAHRRDGSIAAFALLLSDGPWLSFLQCGLDEDAARSEGAYFRLLYEIVRFGIEHRFEQVDLGITTLIPKLDVGGIPIPLFAWVRHRNPVIQRVLRAVATGVLRPDQLEPRRVFKDAPSSAEELVVRRALSV
jgi:predicted N-acyltransferase